MADNIGGIQGFDEAVEEVRAYMESGAGGQEAPGRGPVGDPVGGRDQPEMITIKFGRGLMGDPFTSKAGKELVEVAIPNNDPSDKRPWQTFVLGTKSVHENKYGKGMWAKLPADGHTTISRSIPDGFKDGKKQWKTEKTSVSNRQLKEMVEFYKKKEREPLKEQIAKAQKELGGNSGKEGIRESGRKAADREELPFR